MIFLLIEHFKKLHTCQIGFAFDILFLLRWRCLAMALAQQVRYEIARVLAHLRLLLLILVYVILERVVRLW